MKPSHSAILQRQRLGAEKQGRPYLAATALLGNSNELDDY